MKLKKAWESHGAFLWIHSTLETLTFPSHKLFRLPIIFSVAIFSLSACYTKHLPEELSINTLVLVYEQAHDRDEFQDWLKSVGLEVHLLSVAGRKAEYALDKPAKLSSEQEHQLRVRWEKHYQIKINQNHLLMICCQP